MQVWNVLLAARWKCRTQKIAKNLPSAHHRTTLSSYIFAMMVSSSHDFTVWRADCNFWPHIRGNVFSIPNFLLQWFGSYLSCHWQRVKVNGHISSWKSLNGSIPQGSRLGPLSFIVMIDDLRAPCELHKYVDDSTLSELIPSSCFTSDMLQIFDSVLSWTTNNNMQINTSKTKEMIFGSLCTANLPLLSTSAGSVERVSSFKLLGLNFDASLS